MEGQEQPHLVPPAKKKQPHQIALWLAVGFVLLTFFTPYLTGRFLFGDLFGVYLSYLAWPAMWLCRHFGFSDPWNFIVIMVWGLLAIYFVCYLPVKLWMTTSRHMHIALIAYVALCLFTCWFYQWYSTKPDWTSRGFNPDQPGFEPQVIVLSGEFDYWFYDSAIDQHKSGKAFFEIRMRGHDYYYCRKWHGYDWRVGSWFRVEIANHGEGWSWGLASLSHTTRGTGGSWYVDNLLGQRLWDSQKFVGADLNNLVVEQTKWPNRTEEFAKLVKVARWMIPTHIRLTEKERTENYYIKKIEFQSTPNTNWFEHVMAKYADHNSEFRSVDLGEPGVAPVKRK